MVARWLLFLLATLLMTDAATATAQTPEPVRHTLSFPAPQTNRLTVTTIVPSAGRPSVDLMMAVWTPGSYFVREYARNVEGIVATDASGRALPIVKATKNRWRITTSGSASVTVSYQLYAREMTPRHNWVDASFAIVNGAPTFMTLVGEPGRPHEVTVQPAAGWAQSITSLEAVSGRPHSYRAPNFDVLVDSPLLVGNPDVQEFAVDGKRHRLVTVGAGALFDGPRAAKDLEKLATEHRRFWGVLPAPQYVFFNLLTLPSGQAGGALEHANSVLIVSDKAASRTRQSYAGWLELASHEYFHMWNVKRLRPVELGPFDYESEVLTRSLWVAEGVTDYYGDLLVRRAGFSTTDEYLQAVSSKIDEVQNTPGRLVQSLEQSSFDAWVRQYRPDENSINVAMSYYTKGHVVGLLLDAKIRTMTRGQKSLDDVMRLAYSRYAGAKGYTPSEFRAVAEEVAGGSLASFWQQAVEGVAELDYSELHAIYGLRFRDAASNGRPWLGVATRNDAGRLLVSQVRSDGPAFRAGLNVDDEILGVDEVRVRADRFDARLAQFTPGTAITLLVSRREELVRIPVTLGSAPAARWRLDVDPSATEAQRRALAAWLGQ